MPLQRKLKILNELFKVNNQRRVNCKIYKESTVYKKMRKLFKL